MNALEHNFNPCPMCGGTDISCHAFSISEDCSVECNECGFIVETETLWEGCNNVREHDLRCVDDLRKIWNNY